VSGVDTQAVADATGRAALWLSGQAAQGWPDTAHVMLFPKWAGFTADPERQHGDGFTRAVLAGVLLDMAELDGPRAQDWRALARAEAERLAAARLPHLQGGWSYFPGLPELPPDLDSLGAAISLFARVAPEHLPLAQGPTALALAGRKEGGDIATWLIGPDDHAATRALMQRAIALYWGDSLDIEVNARFHAALAQADAQAHAIDIERGTALLLAHRSAEGDWAPTWYTSRAYATELAMPLLRQSEAGQAALRRALSQAAEASLDNAQDAALTLHLLHQPEAPPAPALAAFAIDLILRQQDRDGHWEPQPWICMDVGRATGPAHRRLYHQSASLTTAWCLRALQGG
jgi:squalene-hopene/tetraprenyl-beta-curcumene cyclase